MQAVPVDRLNLSHRLANRWCLAVDSSYRRSAVPRGRDGLLDLVCARHAAETLVTKACPSASVIGLRGN